MTRLIRFFSDILLFCLLGSIALVLVFKFVPIPFTPLMLKRHIEARQEGRQLDIQHQWTPLEDISPQPHRRSHRSRGRQVLRPPWL